MGKKPYHARPVVGHAKPYGEILDEMDHQAKYQLATNQAELNPVTVATLAQFLHDDQPLMLGGRSQPLSVYLEFARLILSEFNMQRKPPLADAYDEAAAILDAKRASCTVSSNNSGVTK